MRTFVSDEFLLQSQTARELYEKYAANQPIVDYHCHISPRDIAENRQFADLFEIWLEGDHYKWRAMRANSVDERFCTGDAKSYDKFLAWARTVPRTIRNPLYHWTHLELERYFGIGELLDESSAPRVWKRANSRLAESDLSAQGILKKFDVEVVCTTDDPIDSLEHHRAITRSNLKTQVFPTFRPDRAFRTENLVEFNAWVDDLGAAADVEIARVGDLLTALERRHQFFHDHGCRLSDHGLETCPAEPCTDREAADIFHQARSGREVSPEASRKFASFILLYTGHLDAKRGWVKQLHLGALRNVNPAGFRRLGRDTGFDSIGGWNQAEDLARFLGALAEENALPKMILYNMNPADNYIFASMAGNFQDGVTPGKIQLGSGWWFLDQKEGIEWQLNAISNVGLLSRFVGMLTDSRSFMSYPRHEYFRRVLCNLLGSEMESGLIPRDEQLVGKIVADICYHNAVGYFAFPKASVNEKQPRAEAAR